MTTPIDNKQVSPITGRYTVETFRKTDNEQIKTTTFYAKDGTRIKPDYYAAAEARDLANHNGYGKYYKTEVVNHNGTFFLKVTALTNQNYGILAEDYLKAVNDGTIKQYNPHVFEGYNETDEAGHQVSDLNKDMKKGDSVVLPMDKVEIKDSTVGWFRRNVMNIVY